jgi:single-strand DNA-binding protein
MAGRRMLCDMRAHADPELRHTDSGKALTTVSVASSRRDRDADSIYVDLILWDVQAAFAAKHLIKGQAVAFFGRLEPRTWEGREGEQRVALEVHAIELEYGAKPEPRSAPGRAENALRYA